MIDINEYRVLVNALKRRDCEIEESFEGGWDDATIVTRFTFKGISALWNRKPASITVDGREVSAEEALEALKALD